MPTSQRQQAKAVPHARKWHLGGGRGRRGRRKISLTFFMANLE
jgi:hypothetical protein